MTPEQLLFTFVILGFLATPIIVIFGAVIWYFLITPIWEDFWKPLFKGKLPWND